MESLVRNFVFVPCINTLNCIRHTEKVGWEGAHHPYLQLGELNCEGRISRGLLKAPRAAALRPSVTEHSYDGSDG